MNTKIMPIENLISQVDTIEYCSDKCLYGYCSEKPITSHTIAENYLYKLNLDLRNVITFQPKLCQIKAKPDSSFVRKVDKKKFSTFIGFCPTHDNDLFRLIDSFDGIMDNQKAILVHYKNICYGVCHIKSQLLKLQHITKQNYVQDELCTLEDLKRMKMIKNGAFTRRLEYCLDQHLQRKNIIENMLKVGNFDKINFFEISGSLDNPIFCGRSAFLLHKQDNFFKCPGYSSMPWITYMTLLTDYKSLLVFCWLKSDEIHAKPLKKLFKDKHDKKNIDALAYAYSDAFAVEKKFHDKNSLIIEHTIKNLRTY